MAASLDDNETPEQLREAQKAFLLLQLFDADGHSLSQGEANKIPKPLAMSLGLKPLIANHRRARLAEQGYIRVSRTGRTI